MVLFSRRIIVKAITVHLPFLFTMAHAASAWAYAKGVRAITSRTIVGAPGYNHAANTMYNTLTINGKGITALAEMQAKYNFQYTVPFTGIGAPDYFLDPLVANTIFRIKTIDKRLALRNTFFKLPTLFTVNIICLQNGETQSGIPLNINSYIVSRSYFAHNISCTHIADLPRPTAVEATVENIKVINDSADSDREGNIDASSRGIYTLEAKLTEDRYLELIYDKCARVHTHQRSNGSGAEIIVKLINRKEQPARRGEAILIDFDPGKGWFGISCNIARVDDSGNISFKIFSLFTKKQQGKEIIIRNTYGRELTRINGVKVS